MKNKTNYSSNFKKSLLIRSKEGEDIYHIIFNELGVPFEKKDENTYYKTFNPFYDDTSPDLSVYKNSEGLWKHKDHGSDDKGTDYGSDPFELYRIMLKYPKGYFNHLLKLIDIDVTMNCDFGNTITKKPIKEKYKNYSQLNKKYRKESVVKGAKVAPYIIAPTKKCINYFKEYGLDINNFPNVNQISGYRDLDENGNYLDSKKYSDYENRIHIAFGSNGYYKVRIIDPKRFWCIGKKTEEYVFYTYNNEDDYINKLLILTGGEKDAMVLSNLGFDAFCLQSETTSISKKLLKELYNDRKNLVILYDIDDTGIQEAQKLKNTYPNHFRVADLSSIIPRDCRFEITDVADYIKYGLDEQKLIDYLNSFKVSEDDDLDEIVAKANGVSNTVDMSSIKISKTNELRNKETKEITEIKDETDKQINSKNDTKEIISTDKESASEKVEDLIDDRKGLAEEITYNGISNEVYDTIPELLKDICYPIKYSHEKDLVLISSLVVLSNIVKVWGTYDNKTVYPNIFAFITAKASAGKGVLRWIRMLGEKIQSELNFEYTVKMKAYNQLNKEEKAECEKPKKQTYFIPGNASVASFIRQLSYNFGKGVILETEADALVYALTKEWGDFSDLLRKAFEFEPFSMLRKDEENSFEINNPRLSVILTGTQQQLLNLIPNAENGLFSRFMFIEFPLIKKWKKVFDNSINFEDHYKQIAESLLKHYKSNNNEFEMLFTNEQIEQTYKMFPKYQSQLEGLLGEGAIASVRRLGSMHFRICMLFTAIREIDNNPHGKVYCSDIDFENANKILDFLIKNFINIYGYLPKTDITKQKLNLKQTELYNSLNGNFTFSEVRENAKKLDIAYGTAENYLRIFINNQLAVRVKKGHYTKLKI